MPESLRLPAAAATIAATTGLFLVLAGCTDEGPSGMPSPESPSVTEMTGPEDPLTAITDRSSIDFVAEDIIPSLHERGQGQSEFSIARPADATELRFYVSCAPDSSFTVTGFGYFYSGGCAESFQNSGQFPLDRADGDLQVTLDLPSDVAYWIVAIPVG